MVKRVLDERADKAKKAEYKVNLANNIHGEHTLINEKENLLRLHLEILKIKQGISIMSI